MAAPKSGFIKGLTSIFGKKPTGISEEAASMGRLRRQVQMGKRYSDLETPSRSFNVSGFQMGSPTPKRRS